MKKLVLISILISILSVGCKKNSDNCNNCGAELNKITNACEDCSTTEKEDDEKWVPVNNTDEIEVDEEWVPVNNTDEIDT